MKRLDDQIEEKYVKAVIYGPTGTGKTSIGVSAPDPLILLSERQGMVHVREAANRLGRPVPPVLFMQDANDYRNVARALHGAKSRPFQVYDRFDSGKRDNDGGIIWEKSLVFEGAWPETVVIDSMTDACRLFVEEIRRESPPQRGRDGLPVDSQRFWNVLPTRIEAMIHAFRDIPLNVLFLALVDDREHGEDDNKVRQVSPMMPMRKLPATLAAAVNVMGFTYRKSQRQEKGYKLTYGVMTAGPEYMMLKPYRPLRDFEVPDFSYWVGVVRGSMNEQPAPDPSQEIGQAVGEQDKPIQPEPEQQPAAAAGGGGDWTEPEAKAAPEPEGKPEGEPAAGTGGEQEQQPEAGKKANGGKRKRVT